MVWAEAGGVQFRWEAGFGGVRAAPGEAGGRDDVAAVVRAMGASENRMAGENRGREMEVARGDQGGDGAGAGGRDRDEERGEEPGAEAAEGAEFSEQGLGSGAERAGEAGGAVPCRMEESVVGNCEGDLRRGRIGVAEVFA